MPCHAIGSYSQARSIRSYSPPSTRRAHRTAPPYLYIQVANPPAPQVVPPGLLAPPGHGSTGWQGLRVGTRKGPPGPGAWPDPNGPILNANRSPGRSV
jgi:hypothetical protein